MGKDKVKFMRDDLIPSIVLDVTVKEMSVLSVRDDPSCSKVPQIFGIKCAMQQTQHNPHRGALASCIREVGICVIWRKCLIFWNFTYPLPSPRRFKFSSCIRARVECKNGVVTVFSMKHHFNSRTWKSLLTFRSFLQPFQQFVLSFDASSLTW